MIITELAKSILSIQDKPWREEFVSVVQEYVEDGLHFLDYHKKPFSFLYDLHRLIMEEGALSNSSWSAPRKLALKMVKMAGIEPLDIVIDPCAGIGTLLKVAKQAGARVMGYENQFHIYHATKYACPELHVVCGDFMTMPARDGDYVRADIVLLFPPQDLTYKFLRRIHALYQPCRVVAVLPKGFFGRHTGPSNRSFLQMFDIEKIVQIPRELSHWTSKKMAIYNMMVHEGFVEEEEEKPKKREIK